MSEERPDREAAPTIDASWRLSWTTETDLLTQEQGQWTACATAAAFPLRLFLTALKMPVAYWALVGGSAEAVLRLGDPE